MSKVEAVKTDSYGPQRVGVTSRTDLMTPLSSQAELSCEGVSWTGRGRQGFRSSLLRLCRTKDTRCTRAPIALILVFLACLVPTDSAGQVNPTRRILILNEVGPSWPLISRVDQGIRTALQSASYRIEFYHEFLDTVYFPDSADQQMFRDFYIRKYRNHRPDVIITVGSSALRFMAETHRQSFPDVPIVFCFPNAPAGPVSLDSDFTGVDGSVASAATLAIALRLLPDTRHVAVVGGLAPYDRRQQVQIKEQLKIYQDRLDIAYLTDLDMPTLIDRLKRLPSHTVVLLTALGRDSAGTSYTADESGPLVVGAANAPVFSLSDRYLNHGEVGGDLSNATEQGTIAGRMALRLLAGEKPRGIPVIKAGTTYMFDWRALKRWRLKETNLPYGSVLLNRDATFWESYKWYVICSISLVLLQALLIFGLLWQRRRKAKAECELKESEARFRSLADTAPVLIWMAGTDKLCTYVNQPWLHLTGRSLQEELGNGWMDGVHPDDFRKCLDNYTQSFDRRETFRMEYRIRRYDGAYRWVLDVGIPRFQGTSFAGYIGCALDVTERKHMEQTVRESEERLRLAAQAGRMFAYSWDVATDVIERSGEYAEILGVDPKQETTGVAVSAMVHPDDKEQLETALAKLNVDNPFFQSTYRIIRPDGVVTWLQRSSRAYFNEHGELEHIVGMIADVTERKLAEEALSSVSRRLIQAQEQERTRIARELHDDINQRLAMLQVDLSEVRQSTPASRTDLQDRVEEIRESLSDISEEVQAISHRLHSSKLEYLGLVSACKAFCKELANRQNVRIEFDADGVPSSLLQDVSLTLFRVLQESLQNAIKYSDAEHFEVQLRGTSTEIQLTVRDNGIGFDVDSAMRKQGLGLISMRERANLVGGKIFITSQPMHGTEINVRVPVAVARDPEKVIHNAA